MMKLLPNVKAGRTVIKEPFKVLSWLNFTSFDNENNISTFRVFKKIRYEYNKLNNLQNTQIYKS